MSVICFKKEPVGEGTGMCVCVVGKMRGLWRKHSSPGGESQNLDSNLSTTYRLQDLGQGPNTLSLSSSLSIKYK